MQKLITALFLLTLFSCSKETGPQGPAGPQGPQGNANVTTLNFTVNATQWQSENGQAILWYANYSNLYILQSYIDSGAVLVYQVNSDASITPLPYSYNGYNWTFVATNSKMQVSCSTANSTTWVGPNATINYRLVLLSPKMLQVHGWSRTVTAAQASPELNFNLKH